MKGYFKGQYYIGNLEENRAQSILDLVDNVESVPDLKHAIYELTNRDVDLLKSSAEVYEKVNGTLKGYVPPIVKRKLGKLLDYQTKGVAFMYLSQHCLLGDETGMGKTVQIAGLINFLKQEYKKKGKSFRYLFLGEKAGVQQLADKLIKFTNEYVGMLESSEKRIVDKYLKTNRDERYYSLVAGHSLLENPDFLVDCARRPFDMIVFDESAKLKNRMTQIYEAAKALFPKHKYVIELNATPLEVSVWDFYNQLALLDNDYLPCITHFQKEFCEYDYSMGVLNRTFKGYKNENHFRKAIKLRYLARKRKDEGAVYENNQSYMLMIPLSKEQKSLHNKTTLHQLTDDYPSDVDRYLEFNLQTTPKASALLWLIKSLDIKKEKMLVYCQYKHCQDKLKEMIEREGYNVAILNGDTGKRDRAEIISGFNGDSYDVLLTNVQRCLDLNSCVNSVFYTIDRNPQKMVQFEGRVVRDFDVKGKRVYMLIAQGREQKYIEEVLKVRVNASTSFATMGDSMVLKAVGGIADEDSKNEESRVCLTYKPEWLDTGVTLKDVIAQCRQQ